MSALDKVRSFAESTEKDVVPIHDGLTYGDARMILKEIEEREQVALQSHFRRRLPDTRSSITRKFTIDGLDERGRPRTYKGYIRVGLYEDGSPGEIFVSFAKLGGREGRLVDAWATVVSIALQSGVPLSTITEKFSWTRFEPAGMTNDPAIRFCKSPLDYISRWLNEKFGDGSYVGAPASLEE